MPQATPEPTGPELAPELAAELENTRSVEPGGPLRPTAGQIGRTLQEIATMLELTNANPFKVRAYENAARALAGLGEDLALLVEENRLRDVRGIGSGIAERVATLAREGRLEYYEELQSRVPSGLLEMLRVPGLGPKKAKVLHETLDIGSVDELEAACRSGKLETLRGFGIKTQENILLGIGRLRRAEGRYLWRFAAEIVGPVLEGLRADPNVGRLEVAGSLRRCKEVVHDIDILTGTSHPVEVMQRFVAGPWVGRVLGSGETKTSILHPSGIQIDLRAVSDDEFPYALHHFTGSKEHNIAMRARAQRMGIKMNEYGIFRGEERIPCRDETEIFKAIGLDFVPPEMREDLGEIEAATTGGLPDRLIEEQDLRGVFHVHTHWSDGRSKLDAMVRGAARRGWAYVGISDHSRSAVYAHGLEPDRIRKQALEIEQINRKQPGIRVFHGIEADIGPDGGLDYPDEVLGRFDFVIASVHGAFHLGREDQTRRLVRAIENPYTTILGHPTGRILLHRPGYDVDLPVVFEAAARHGVVLEINAHPQRLDLDGPAAKLARDLGALVSIEPDAHDENGLGHVSFGVGTARRGWIEPRHVLNTWSLAEVEAHLGRRREGREARRS